MKIFTNDEARRRVLFADNLRYIIRSNKISINKLAKKVGVSSSMIQHYKSGKTFPREDTIEKLAEGLGCTVDDLFDDTYAPWKFGLDD